ncbi:hypothetical protein KAM380_086550 [Aeromonas caviae]|nr:hypothetical protein KAM380_086550 [Aeromonas caviae]
MRPIATQGRSYKGSRTTCRSGLLSRWGAERPWQFQLRSAGSAARTHPGKQSRITRLNRSRRFW